MQPYLVAVTFDSSSGLAQDRVVNTFACEMGDSWEPTEDGGELTLAIANFYQGANASYGTLSSFLSPRLSRSAGAADMKVYDLGGHLSGSPHGSPAFVDSFTPAAASNSGAMPDEVAICLTLRASDWDDVPVETADGSDAGSAPDRPRARHTGRMFFGPLNDAARRTVSGRSYPSTEIDNALRVASERLYDSFAALGGSWSVWSRKDAVLRPVVEVQVDDAWDTQRRRGLAPTGRSIHVLGT